MVLLLLEARAEIEASTTREGLNALHLAASEGQLDIVNILIEAGAKKNARAKDGVGCTALHFSSRNGHLEVCRRLLTAKAALKAMTAHGVTPLHFAAEGGHLQVVQLLVEAGAQKDAAVTETAGVTKGTRPIHCAIHTSQLEVVRFLVEAGASADGTLAPAVLCGNSEVVELLLKSRAAIDAASEDGITPLHVAAVHGKWDMVKLLVDSGADKNAATAEEGMTALCFASAEGCLEMVEWLVEAGADKDVVTAEGKTAFSWAVERRHMEVAKFLLHAGAREDASTAFAGKTFFLHRAAEAGRVDMVLRLLENKACCDQPLTSLRVRPLHLAAQNGHLKVVQVLLEAGAREDAAMADGKTALFLAEVNGHLDIVSFLLLR
eukprot:Skav215671  [mRNA]  locus=scaffold310:174339:175472:- [translate_table: standard]